MTKEARKIEVVRYILGNIDEETLTKLEIVIANNRNVLEQQWKDQMVQRALKAEQNIVNGKLYNRQQFDEELSRRMDI